MGSKFRLFVELIWRVQLFIFGILLKVGIVVFAFMFFIGGPVLWWNAKIPLEEFLKGEFVLLLGGLLMGAVNGFIDDIL